MTKRRLIQTLLGLAVLLAGYLAAQNPAVLDDSFDSLEQNQPGLYQVEEVSDGDTIIVNMSGTREIVRLIGIDTPETHHPDRPVECFGKEASEFARKSLVDRHVRLEADPINTNRDRYKRLLRYAYLEDGSLFNSKVVEHGYGFSYTSFPFSKTQEFETLEDQAEQARSGLWGHCTVTVDGSGVERTNPAPRP